MVLGVAYGIYAIRRVHPTVSRRSELLELAAKSLATARGLAPRNASLSLHLALVLADLRDVARASEHVWRALGLQPRSAAAWMLAALLQSSRREYRAALETCDAALRVLPDELPRFAVVKGKLYCALGRYAEALACYREVFVWKARQGAAEAAAENSASAAPGGAMALDGEGKRVDADFYRAIAKKLAEARGKEKAKSE